MIEKPNASIRAGGKTYSPNEVHAILARLAQLGINRDKIIAQITLEEAMVLKRLGGSGKINPKTGLLSFDDDGGGGGDDGGGGGDDGGGEGEGSGGGAGYGDDGGGYSGGEYDGGGSYDGYGGGWEGGTGGTYGGGEPAGGEPEGGEPGGGGAGFGGEPEGGVGYADEDAASFGGEKSGARVESDGPSYGANIGALQDAYEQSLAEQVAANNAFMSGAIQSAISGTPSDSDYSPGYGGFLTGVSGLGNASFGGFGPSGATGTTYGGWGGQSGNPFGAAPTETLDQIDVIESAPPSWVGGAPVAPNEYYSTPEYNAFIDALSNQNLSPSSPYGDINTALSAAANPFGFVSDADKAAIAAEAAAQAKAGQILGNEQFGPLYSAPANPFSKGNQPEDRELTINKAPGSLPPDIIQGVLDAAPAAPNWTTPPANIPNLPTVREEQPVEPQASPVVPSGVYETDVFGPGVSDGGEWVKPTELVPEVSAPTPTPSPPVISSAPATPETPAAAPVLPLQLIDWYHYGERYPEFQYYQSNRVPTPYKAHGGYFDADAYFADGGLVSQPQQPVQPVTASAPTMAYTDGQGVVGAAAAPPALSPFDAYGLDVQRASPMAPAPAAAAPSFGGLEALATRNRNAAPVQSQISQNPNLGYSLGVSPLSQIRG